ncbi:MAG: DUF1893 domain-containing protein [Dehalococcoidales bacterium]
MPADLYADFLASADTLRIYRGKKLVFTSPKDRLLPLMDYLAADGSGRPVTIYDKIMGNAAALLSVMAHARDVFSPLGSELAVSTLENHGIKYHLDEIVPCIMRDDGKSMCPMEQLSLGKAPGEFYQEMKKRIAASV